MRDALKITLSSALLTVAVLVVLSSQGLITFQEAPEWLVHPLDFAYTHLRESLIVFAALGLAYVFLILKLRRLLQAPDAAMDEVLFTDRLLNTVVSTFFVVGVIWTAIGMEGALQSALKGFDATQGGQGSGTTGDLSAMTILSELVNGGLLLALSTTIFGGAMGQLLRILKVLIIGRRWEAFLLAKRRESAHGA